MAHLNRKQTRRKVHFRIRKKVEGTTQRPRLAIHFSNKNVYAQIIDDEKGVTIASASTKDKKAGISSAANSESAAKVGAVIAERGKSVVSMKWFLIEVALFIAKKLKPLQMRRETED